MSTTTPMPLDDADVQRLKDLWEDSDGIAFHAAYHEIAHRRGIRYAQEALREAGNRYARERDDDSYGIPRN